MGQRIDPKEKIVQRSIGFNFRQIMFFNEHPEFKPDIYCRKAIDNQIKEIAPEFLNKDDKIQNQEPNDNNF